MATLVITTEKYEGAKNGLNYHFSHSNIDYMVYFGDDCVNVWKTNNKRGTMSSDCYWNGINNQGKKMAKFLQSAIKLIED